MLAFPEYRFAILSEPTPDEASYLRRAVSAFVRGDRSTTHTILDDLRRVRRHVDPSYLAVEALYTEATLLRALGDTSAGSWIDPTLDAIDVADPLLFADPVNAAALVRLLALRAEVAVAMRDRLTAHQWATAVTILWSDADAFLQPSVQRMLALTK